MNYQYPPWWEKRLNYVAITDETINNWVELTNKHNTYNWAMYNEWRERHGKFIDEASRFYGMKSAVVKVLEKVDVELPPDFKSKWTILMKKVNEARAENAKRQQRQQKAIADRQRRSEAAQRGAQTRKENRREKEREDYLEGMPQSD